MIIKSNKANRKNIGQMEIQEYKINSDFSASLIKINGHHGKMKCIAEDRIYFVIDGEGEFIIDGKREDVCVNDLVFIPKNTPYDIIGKLKYLLICNPEFDPRDDVFLSQ